MLFHRQFMSEINRRRSPMTSCPSLGRQPTGSPHPWDGLLRIQHSLKRILKTYQHACSYSNYSRPISEGKGRRVAISTEDSFLPSFDSRTLTGVTQAANFCLDTLGIDQDCLGHSLQDILAPTPTLASDSLPFPSKPTGLLRTLHSMLKASSSSLFSPSFPLRSFQWFCGLLMTENSCSPDSLVYFRTDKYPEKRNDGGNPSNHASFVEASSTSYWRCENVDKSVLGLIYPFQVLNSSSQADPSSPPCLSFVGQNKQYWYLPGSCTSPEVAHDILPSDGVKGCDPTIGKLLFKFEGYVHLEDKSWASSIKKEKGFIPNRQLGDSFNDPEDNSGFVKKEEDGNSRTPADGETSTKPPKRQRQNSPYNQGTNGTTKAGKKRKRDSIERDGDDFDESGRGNGRPNTGKRRKDEEESAKNKFACPFYKNNPQAFRGSRTCVGPGWSSVHRVKEHIFRRHMLSGTQCHECLQEFGDDHVALDKHRRVPCRQKPPLKSGINKKQEKELRSRRMYQKSLDEEEKWRAIYKIIFPGEENIPSPYYEPEVPEFPDYYRQMFIQKLPGIVTEQLIAQGSRLMRQMANQQTSSGSENRQLVRQIEDVVKDAVQKTLSQVDGSKEPIKEEFQIPLLNIESPEEESKDSMEKGKQMQLPGPALLQHDLLQPPVSGAGLKLDTRAQYPTPTSSAFSRSPEMQFGSTELRMGATSPLDFDLTSLFGDTAVLHTTGGTPNPELPSVNWDSLNNSTIFSGGMYTPIRQNSNPNVCGPAGGQNQDLQNQDIFSSLETGQENYLLGSLDFAPQVTSVQSVDSGYGSITGPLDSNGFDTLDFDNWWSSNDGFKLNEER